MKTWNTGSLLTFQQNLNTNVKNLAIKYECVDSHLLRPTFNIKETITSSLLHEGRMCVDLSNIRWNAMSKVEPHKIKRETCFLMLLSNLAEPDWISVSCRKRILHVIICATISNNTNNSFIENNLKDKNQLLLPYVHGV